MLDDEENAEFHRYDSHYGKYVKGNSPDDQVAETLAQYELHNSKALKKMQTHVLQEQAEQCYQDRWMSEDFPNSEQIAICKQEVQDRIMGSLISHYDKVRLSSAFKYQDCVNNAGNNVMKFVYCVQDYNSAVKADNENLKSFIKSNYAKYLWKNSHSKII